jgi:hypothetical protein
VSLFPGISVNSDNLPFFLRDNVSVFTYVSIFMKIDPGIHIVTDLVFLEI